MTYTYEGFPLIRMNSAITRAYFVPALRERMLAHWLEKYGRQGVGLCTNVLKLIAFIRPNGTLHELQPPFRRFQMWQMANAPKVFSAVEPTCACGGYYDPEVGGAWRERGLGPTHHHPFCQFSRTSQRVWVQAAHSAMERVERKLPPQTRPDEWLRRQREAEE